MQRRAASVFSIALVSFIFTTQATFAASSTTAPLPVGFIQAFIAGFVRDAEAVVASIVTGFDDIAALGGSDAKRSYTASGATPLSPAANVAPSPAAGKLNPVPLFTR